LKHQNNTAKKFITIQSQHKNDMLIIEVIDNGGGIDKEIIHKIFQPYFTTKFEAQGTGLGLYMSKMIIEKNMNGTIQAFNTKDGATFQLVFRV
jgi:signal transduction histidine kinase